MKKNLILAGILAALLIVTYFVQEKRVEDNFERELTEGRLLQEEMTHIKFPNGLEAKKKGDKWFSNETQLSHNLLKLLEKKLGTVKEIKGIEGKWNEAFGKSVNFEVNHKAWAIGDLALDKKSFYVAKEGKVSLAVIDAGSTEITTNEEELEAMKLNELLGLLNKTPEELKETQLFRFFNLPMERVTIKVEGSLAFELDLKKNETLPPPIQGISVHPNISAKLMSLLSQVTIKEELPYDPKLKVRKMGEVRFIGEKGEKVWELWLKSKTSADAVIFDDEAKKAFLMIGGTLKLFFVHVQDYWDKKIIPPSAFGHFTRLPVTISQGKKSDVVTVVNREPLDFQAEMHRVKMGNMQDLFQLIFNLGRLDQAERVSQLSTSEKKMLLSEEHLRLEVMGQELLLWKKQQELIVVNLTQGFKAHFLMGMENYNARFEDVLE